MTTMNVSTDGDKHRFMQRAIHLAQQAAGGALSPRPPVGAVVAATAANGKHSIVGEGATQPNPGPHAEHVALQAAGEKARGGTIYVTLEPHQFHGTTPPCTDAIIQAGIRKVVCPIQDPNPKVNGKGFDQLRQAGIEIDHNVNSDQLRQSNELIAGFHKLITHAIPFVTAKWAMSLDGKIATHSRDSKWITNKQARDHAHRIRYASDAIITGIGTILADNPRLTARDPETDERADNRPRIRVVVDSTARIPRDAAILQEEGEVILATAMPTKTNSISCETIALPDHRASHGHARVDLDALMKLLAERGCANVLIEAGSKLTASFFEAQLVDKVVVYISTSKIIGGENALSPVAGLGAENMTKITKLHNIRTETLGQDIAVIGYIQNQHQQ